MKYIENDGQVTREYEVKINTSELEKVIKELEEKCYRVVSKKTKVAAKNENEALDKLNVMDKSKITVNKLVDISDKYPKEVNSTGLHIFDCEYLCRQNSYLVYILETILSNYRSSLEFKNQNYRFIDLLIQYENNDELKPYDERMKEYEDELSKFADIEGDSKEILYQKKLKETMASTLIEMKNNPNYDFDLLKKLYENAKECFGLILVAETVHYKDIDKNPKVYKLGTKKMI